MNLTTTIELQSGGAGSGCHGPNCGRPHTREERSQQRRTKLQEEFRNTVRELRKERATPLQEALLNWTSAPDNYYSRPFKKEAAAVDTAYAKGKSHPILDAMTERSKTKIFRGTRVDPNDPLLKLRPGEVINYTPKGFSKDKQVADYFSYGEMIKSNRKENGVSVLVTVLPGAKVLDVEKGLGKLRKYRDVESFNKEQITAGKFKVMLARPSNPAYYNYRYTIVLKPLGK